MTAESYDFTRLEDPMDALIGALAQWETRHNAKAQPEVRRAANTAMDSIDAMLRELHALRSRLISEIRDADDAAAARVDALLAKTPA